ncbi:MAG: dephospho-CoA kinase [Syntrophobacteraceae bacterium]|nr:dephospho-CoA kinase [Syntrophobacteraceae bacterium]
MSSTDSTAGDRNRPKPVTLQPAEAEGGRFALTGGIATGKSTVAEMFTRRGAVVLDADRAAREVVAPGSPWWSELRELLGPAYFDAEGTLQRRALRERIVRDGRCRRQVESILHPAILQLMERRWQEILKSQPGRPILFDIPLLFEANLDHRFTIIILVYAPREVQIQRLMARDNLSFEQARETLQMQLPIESKRERSHYLIDNSGTLDQTEEQVEALFTTLFGASSPAGPHSLPHYRASR